MSPEEDPQNKPHKNLPPQILLGAFTMRVAQEALRKLRAQKPDSISLEHSGNPSLNSASRSEDGRR